ncbi:MAG TPA: hypothetical protein VMR16_02705 [Candidatus Saccharimonadales bacterium]|nr:hypothetical protein [Candidatus Saccharimonadales bacterium]
MQGLKNKNTLKFFVVFFAFVFLGAGCESSPDLSINNNSTSNDNDRIISQQKNEIDQLKQQIDEQHKELQNTVPIPKCGFMSDYDSDTGMCRCEFGWVQSSKNLRTPECVSCFAGGANYDSLSGTCKCQTGSVWSVDRCVVTKPSVYIPPPPVINIPPLPTPVPMPLIPVPSYLPRY